MISTTLLKALNDQINFEFASAYAYLAMSAYFEDENLPGFAQWMRAQAKEEVEHAMRLYDFVNDRGGGVKLPAIAEPKSSYDSPIEVVAGALEHEKKVTKSIHDLYALAVKENDYATQTHLHWFIDEQVEEEKTMGDVLARLQLAGNNTSALIMVDQHLSARAAE